MNKLIEGLYVEGEKIVDTKAPHDVPIDRRWEQRKFEAKLVNPANRRKLESPTDPPPRYCATAHHRRAPATALTRHRFRAESRSAVTPDPGSPP